MASVLGSIGGDCAGIQAACWLTKREDDPCPPAGAGPAADPAASAGFAQARTDLATGGFIIGWVVTALAVSLGAPFWFDVLNRFMVVRSTVKHAEKSAPDGSKDGTGPRAARDPPAPVAPRMAPPGGTGATGA